ncbi:M1 family aminopeptidase [Sporolactobacillus vineae]|uniref:M1 family aminopeptidase n=1 Tax=Sporolactobacillus vineae TaxID=444463 RepID=UPI0002E17750|nr:M1 family aminopeptidase [Sporolactobacillus vineae]
MDHWSPFITDAKSITITLKDHRKTGKPLTLVFDYEGCIHVTSKYEVNRITKEWIEIGLYAPWYPLLKSFVPATFDVIIHLDSAYQVINAKRSEEGIFEAHQTIPQIDCPIIASDQFRLCNIDYQNAEVKVYYTQDEYRHEVEVICSCVESVLSSYEAFGKIQSRVFSVVIAPRTNGGGYCRSDLIVVTPDEERNEADYFRFIAHELAHLWWHEAPTTSWEDWLNESFAEYSALMALRQKFGQQIFLERIIECTKLAKGLPPIIGLSRNDEKAHTVLYDKGPLILNQLEKSIGRKEFIRLLHTIHVQKVTSTQKLLDVVAQETNAKTKQMLVSMLRSKRD